MSDDASLPPATNPPPPAQPRVEENPAWQRATAVNPINRYVIADGDVAFGFYTLVDTLAQAQQEIKELRTRLALLEVRELERARERLR